MAEAQLPGLDIDRLRPAKTEYDQAHRADEVDVTGWADRQAAVVLGSLVAEDDCRACDCAALNPCDEQKRQDAETDQLERKVEARQFHDQRLVRAPPPASVISP
ncbi:hypothetical protein [Roseitranquillus sediminis]|uniref:hypothetical protein n=1 Tax=Roseitranquillus sediminis TaxID=2809051 RepID=UPI001D0C726F|nr:hypothetical protein [Roseitranquillus sediminis]MBM9594051.1 hypothetical protein [Roseitranquillus sediminis]